MIGITNGTYKCIKTYTQQDNDTYLQVVSKQGYFWNLKLGVIEKCYLHL